MGNERKAKGMLAHELVHLIAFRSFYCGNYTSRKVEELFSFNKEDARLFVTSAVGYTSAYQNEEVYFQNREEVLAYKIENRFHHKFKKNSQAETNPAP
jgi:hypothetical protein